MGKKHRAQETFPTRPNLGLFAHYSGFPIWLGTIDAALEHDANMFCFFGYEINHPEEFYCQSNVIYDLVDEENLDGLITWGGQGAALHVFLDEAETRQFFTRYPHLPIVNYEMPIQGIPSVITETYQGMQDALIHLIETHHCRRIVLVRGPEGHHETEERCRAYVETLDKFGIPYDERLVAPPSWFRAEDGIKAIGTILDERRLRPGIDFDAIAFTDDSIIIGVLKELQARGVKIPEDVAMAGFSDSEVARSCTPPLTTAPKPFYDVGRKTAELLLAKMAGEAIPDQSVLSTHLIIRQSCGCMDPLVVKADLPAPEILTMVDVQSDAFLAQLQDAIRTRLPSLDVQTVNELVRGFLTDLCEASSGHFLKTLRGILHQAALSETNVIAWQDAISVMRSQILPGLADQPTRTRAETLWNQARILIGETEQRVQTYKGVKNAQQAQIMRQLGSSLITAFDIQDLMNILASGLPSLGIPSGYLALYERPQPYQYPQPAPEWSRLMLAYHENGRIPLEAGGRRFRSRQRVPQELLPQDRAYGFVVEPLYFREHQLGFVLFEVGPRDGGMYAALAGQISSALQGALLVKQVKERVTQLNAAATVSSFTSSILNPDELIQQTVELVRERFDLYYVGLFLVDANARWAELRAGTGEAGQQMIAKRHRLEINESSMIGWCIANRKSRIALDVGQDAIRFNNPFLPETRSELALPLLSRGQAIGALTIQSSQPQAFSQEDVIVLQTMADQLANAIENTRLFEQTQQRAVELSKAREAADIARQTAESAKEEIKAEKEAAERAKEEAEKARKESEAANHSLALQMWQTTGQAQLNECMRGEQDIPTLGRNVIQELCEYLNVPTGALYIREEKKLRLAGTCAFQRNKLIEQFEIGEGMVGEAALRQRNILLKVPEKYLAIMTSTLGELPPQHVLFAPFVFDGDTIGVIELGALEEFSPTQIEFLNKALESVAIAFMTAQARRKVNELLIQTRQQAEELQAQEEELRATNEELESQTESLRASETRLKQNQAALEAANVELEEKAHILQQQQDKVDQQNRELERKAEELALASKYKSEFLANMSHELRTPLNSMLILAGMLAKNESGHLSSDEVESAQVIHSGGTDLLNLINEILDLAKVEAGKMEFRFAPMPWSILIDRMNAQFGPIAQRKGLQFITNVAEDLPPGIVTDEQRLAQIVKNLLSNAFKFTEQGRISLIIQRAIPDSDFDSAHFCSISVTDTGIGMTPEQQKVVFEAFQQADGSTSRQYGGTGLGLTITREMTHRLGGQVTLSSEPGKGSVFTIYLPLKGEGERVTSDKVTGDKVNTTISPGHPITQSPNHPVTPSPSHPLTPSPIPDDREHLDPADRILLIVEDDAKFAKIVRDYAHKKHFKCLVAGDGESALALSKAHCPAAIILDLKLPGLSGWDVLDTLKDDPDMRHIPIHIMSVDDEDLSAYQRGAIGFLTKPVSQKTLEGAFGKIEAFISSKIRTLLLVEDDAALRLSVRKLLDGSDIAITEAATGQAALQHIAHRPFDCMILDLSLPDISGFELLNRLDSDESLPKCPVIVYTGKELSPEENQELLKYADSVIVKGVKSPERLLDETALFLHRVVADMPADKQQTIRKLHNREAVLQGKQILIVDDDARNAFALSRLLNEKGVKMHIAASAAKALELLERIEVSLILTDIMMPGMDGYEFIRTLRQQPRFQRIPVIALTAKAMKGDREKCLEAGANDYLSKPIDPERLFSMLRVWLSK